MKIERAVKVLKSVRRNQVEFITTCRAEPKFTVVGTREFLRGFITTANAIRAILAELSRLRAENAELRRERDTLIDEWPQLFGGGERNDVIQNQKGYWSVARDGAAWHATKAEAARDAAGLPPKGGENVG